MKKFSKILSVALLVALVLSLGVANAFAANDGYTITINPSNVGQIYTVYKLFNATTNASRQAAQDTSADSDVNTSGISYTLPTGKSLETEYTYTPAGETDPVTVKGSDWFSVDAGGNISLLNGKTASDLATENFRQWAKLFGEQVAENTATTTTLEFAGLADGYYFISTTTGSLATVTSVAPNALVKDKNRTPSIDKTVQEDSLITAGQEGNGVNGYQKKNDADLGQTVYYKTVVTAQPGAEGYVVHDKMTGLTFKRIDSVKANNNEVTGYSVNTSDLTDGCAFELSFDQAFLNTITEADTTIEILYSATVNQDAVIAGEGNPNETWLVYGANGEGESTHKTTKTYVWQFDILKYADNDPNNKKLAGATFKLSTDVEGNNVLHFVQKQTMAGDPPVETLVKNTYQYKADGSVSSFTTDENGYLYFEGLDEGIYYLTETEAPAGYNKLTAPIKVTITSSTEKDSTEEGNKTCTVKSIATDAGQGVTENVGRLIQVNNNSGTVLPSTGGIGTTIFYVVGGVLVLAAIILLVTKKRMSE